MGASSLRGLCAAGGTRKQLAAQAAGRARRKAMHARAHAPQCKAPYCSTLPSLAGMMGRMMLAAKALLVLAACGVLAFALLAPAANTTLPLNATASMPAGCPDAFKPTPDDITFFVVRAAHLLAARPRAYWAPRLHASVLFYARSYAHARSYAKAWLLH